MSGNPRILTQREKRYFDHADYRLQTDSGRLHVYTDGSTIGNGRKNARGGYGVFFGHPEIPYISRDLNSSKVTNNTAELKAIIEALKVISKLDQSDVIIHYDSEYAAGVITGQKQAHKNLDLVNEGKDLLRTLSHKVIKFEHVYSHTGHLDLHSIGNEIADDLARRRPGQAPIL
jgi:ribonuclease HI